MELIYGSLDKFDDFYDPFPEISNVVTKRLRLSTIHKKNEQFKFIRSLGFLDITKGNWVAGGAVRRLLTDPSSEDYSDVDIFLGDMQKRDSTNHASRVLKHRNDLNFIESSSSPNDNFLLSSAKYSPLFTVQVITTHTFSRIEELFNSFDFTICLAATDGWNWVADKRFFHDVKAKRLALVNPNKPLKQGRSARLAKYCSYGFTPMPGVVEGILSFDSKDTVFDQNGNIQLIGNDVDSVI